MKEKDALYAEAEAVYRTFFTESVRLSRAGGMVRPSDVLLATSTGAYLENMESIFTGMHERGVEARGDDPEITVSRLPGRAKANSLVALSVCIDSRGWDYYGREGRVSSGRIAVDEVYFARSSGRLKMIGADGREVSKC